MKFTRESSSAVLIRSVSSAGIRIGERTFDRTIGLTTDEVLDDWGQKDIQDLSEEDFSPLLALKPEVILLGTGASNVFPPRELVFSMARRNVGFEVMDSAAAARTYNVLASEGRRVAALLYCI